MSLNYAILGFLNYSPFTGYDLKKMFDNSVRHFWSADQSQIYRTLAHLTEQGWAEMQVVEQSDRPDRKVYSITPAGREALLNWLASPIPTQEPRSGPLVQVFFAGQLPDEAILAKFEYAAALMREVLARYAQVPARVEEYEALLHSPREAFMWRLTLELGIKEVQAQLEWAESIIARIKNHELPPA